MKEFYKTFVMESYLFIVSYYDRIIGLVILYCKLGGLVSGSFL